MSDNTDSTDLQMTDSFSPPDGGTDPPTRPQVVLPPKPGWVATEFQRFSNVVFSSATCSLLRVFTAPPAPPPPPQAETLPSWYTEEFQRKARYKLMMRQYLRDTALLTAAAYIMDGVEATMHTIRGKEDALNKTLGGVAAGGMMGFAWFPARPHARAILTSTGALVGYVSFALDRASKAVLLDQQQKLEKEVLGVPDDDVKKELDTAYIRELIKMRQKQLADAAEAMRKQGLPGGAAAGRGWNRQQAEAGNTAAGNASVPEWVRQASSDATTDGSTSRSRAGGAAPEVVDEWADSSNISMQDTYPQGPSAGGMDGAGVGVQPGERRRSFWGWGRGRGQQQTSSTGSGADVRDMQIREESDERIVAEELQEPVRDSLVINDQELPPPR